MSISNALSNALSGLTAVSRAADVVSNNVSNAMTEGYGRREIEYSARMLGRNGAGVQVDAINRVTDPVATAARRVADGQVGLGETRSDFHNTFAQSMGQVDDPSSIAGRMTTLESALIEAASRPESEPRLMAVFDAASDLTRVINNSAKTLEAERMNADKQIGLAVDFLQSAFDKVVELNVTIQQNSTAGYDVNALIDQRQRMIDRIAEYIPVKEVPRDNGMVALYSPGGAIFVDSKAAKIEFTPVPTITPDMTLANGALSGLTVNGQPVSTDPDQGAIAGGKLAGYFEVRDVLAPAAQVKLDAVARDLVERFQNATTDPSLGTTDAGLFTDNGAFFDATNEESLARRLSVNTRVDPDNGGELWRLRDGIMINTEGNQGDSSLLNSMARALQDSKVTQSGGFVGIERNAVSLASDFYSIVQVDLRDAEAEQSFAMSRQETFKAVEQENGVDTDAEMQRLMLIEQNYAANAKVIETINQLIDQLVRIS